MKTASRAAIFSALLLLLPTVASAASNTTGTALQVGPGTVELGIKAGKSGDGEFSISNRNGVDVEVKIFAAASNPDGTNVNIAGNQNPAKWITIANPNRTIPSQGTSKVPFTVDVPSSAQPGSHYANIFVQPQPTAAVSDSQSPILGVVGVRAIIDVPGNAVAKLTTSGFVLPGLATSSPVKITLPLLNSGNVQIGPSGTVLITNSGGDIVARYPVNRGIAVRSPNTIGLIYPHTSQNFPVQFKPKSLGHYKVSVDLRYAGNKHLLVETASFWYIPMWILVVGLIAIIAIIGTFVYFGIRKIRKPKDLTLS